MRKPIILLVSIYLFSFTGIFAQLVKFPLTYDPVRNNIAKVASKQINKKARVQAVMSADTVTPFINISIISGQNPVCTSDAGISKPFAFKAQTANGGGSPVFQWFVDGIVQAANSSVLSVNLQSGQNVYCQFTSSLSCVKPASTISNTIAITSADTLQSSGYIKILAGDNPSCVVKSSITLAGVLLNCGTETGQNLRWFYADTFTGITGPTFTSDSLVNNAKIYFILKPTGLGCSQQDSVISAVFTKSILTSITPLVTIKLDSITNDVSCTKIYNFSASPVNGGGSPVYSWYVNSSLTGTTTGLYFGTSDLLENGDEVYVSMASSLYCVNTKNIASDVFQRTDTISLPVFDDFSTSAISPNKKIWVKNGGTFINNTYTSEPPSYNAATFDGLKYNGTPYDTASNTSRGTTDNLTSLPINLSDSLANKNVYISFYWQPQGLGEPPDSIQGDYLSLYFKNEDQSWIKVWTQGGGLLQNFKQEIVNITNFDDNNFFHRGFQFKFETTGRLSGSFDVWNVDYIYLNKNRSSSDTSFNDQAFSRQPGSILKKYSAMPIRQFLANPSQELRDTLLSTINNLSATFNNIYHKERLYFNDTVPIPPVSDSTFLQIKGKQKGAEVVLDLNKFDISSLTPVRTEIVSTFSLRGDSINSDGKEIDYAINNKITSKTILDNFLAYDDGSAEYGIGINQKFGIVAYRFVLNQPDTLRQIAIYFTKLGKILASDASFNLFVSDTLPTQGQLNITPYPANIYYNENQLIKYPTIINDFTIYELSNPIILSDTFYIGYKQISDDIVTIGWDVNTDASAQMYYFTSGIWESYYDDPGSMMIRPVFGKYNYSLGVSKPDAKSPEPAIYPNPTTGILHIDNTNYTKATVYDLIGLPKAVFSANDNPIDIGHLPEGVYLIKIETINNVFVTRKVVVVK